MQIGVQNKSSYMIDIRDMEQKDKGDVKWKYSTYCSALKKDIKL